MAIGALICAGSCHSMRGPVSIDALVAQLDRALDYESRGWGFKSLPVHHPSRGALRPCATDGKPLDARRMPCVAPAQGEAGPNFMYHVYLLRSIVNPRRTYVGFTTLAPPDRLVDHNAGRVPHTSKFRPWEITAFVAVTEQLKAIRLEKYFKSGSGYAFAHKHLW